MSQDFKSFKIVFMVGQKKAKNLGKKSGKGGERENLVARIIEGKRYLIAPIVFTRSLNPES